MKKKLLFILLALGLMVSACIPSQEQINEIINSLEQTALAQVTVVAPPTQDLNAIVQATLQALTAQASTPVPTDQNGATDVIPTFTPPGGQAGSVSGTLSYPAEGLPAMAVVAFHANAGPADHYYVATSQGQASYQIDNLPPGNYWIVVYSLGGDGIPSGLAGGYTEYVVCGMQPACSNHALVEVIVNGGQLAGNINPQDWYAPEGTFPENPLP